MSITETGTDATLFDLETEGEPGSRADHAYAVALDPSFGRALGSVAAPDPVARRWFDELAVFDLETTGIDVRTSRIVTAHVGVIDASGTPVEATTWLADPGVEIPAGASAVQYGLACLELEAADSGIRSLVSVQGSLAMYAIHRFGSEEQKQRWLPSMAAGEVIGCFGLTEPDHGSDPAEMRTHAKRDGGGATADWILSGRKMWITNGSVAGVAVVWAQTDEGIRGFAVRFVAVTPVHAQPTCHGTVRSVEDGVASVDLVVRLSDGTTTLTGTAVIDLT